jgi:hypothetical protein
MGLSSPGSCAILKASLATNSGTLDLRGMCREVKIHESMLRPFIVLDMQIIDPTNFGNEVRIVGGEELSFVASNVYGDVYDIKLQATKQTNEIMSASLRSQGSTISFAGPAFFKNKSAKVQESFKNIPGSAAIQKIQQKYLGGGLNKMIASMGMLAEKQPYIVHNQRPLEAIKKIRYGITATTSAATGAYAFYQDIKGMNLVPLAHAFGQSAMDEFVQDGTVGRSFLDVFRLESQIIAFAGGTSFGGGSMDPAMIAQSSSAATHKFDFQAKKFFKGMPKKISAGLGGFPLGGVLAQIAGEAATHYIAHDPNVNMISPDEVKAAGEKLIAHLAQSAGSFTMAVLLDRGIHLTAGENVNAKLAAPRGDLTGRSSQQNRLGGKALIVNLCHHIKNYDSQPQGTTILECSQGGTNLS